MTTINLESLSQEAREDLLNYYKNLLQKSKKKEKSNLSKYAGILNKLPIEPLEYQKKIRDEWN